MAIPILNELQQRLHTVAIAGVGVISEDFRLKKSIAQMEAIAAQSPIFAKIHQTTLPLIDPENTEKETALLDAITLVDAVVCTQGDYKIDGDVQPLVLRGSGTLNQCRYGELLPLLEAINSTGSGHYGIVYSAFQTHEPVLSDFRLRASLVKALSHHYGEMVTLVSDILEYLGSDIIPTLKQDFDPKGKKYMARRVAIIRNLAGIKENDFYLYLLENGNSDIKQEAIKGLALDNKNVELLVSLAKTEKGNIKKTVMQSLSEMDTVQSNQYWLQLIQKDPKSVLPYITCLADPSISDAVADMLDEFIHTPCTAKTKDEITNYMGSLIAILETIANKASEKLCSVLMDLAKNPPDLPMPISYEANEYPTKTYTYTLNSFISKQIVAGLIYNPRDEVKDMVARLYKESTEYISAAFTASMITDTSIAYDEFSSYFECNKTEEAEQLFYTLNNIHYQEKSPENEYSGYIFKDSIQVSPYFFKNIQQIISQTLDIRWFKLLMQAKMNPLKNLIDNGHVKKQNNDNLLLQLINPDDTASIELLRDYFYKRTKLAINEDALQGYKLCGGDDFSGMLLKLIKKEGTVFWNIQHLYQTYPIPLETALDELKQIKLANNQNYLEAWILRLKTGEEMLCPKN